LYLIFSHVHLQLIAETLTEDEISGLKEMFQSMDVDKSGSLTIDELRHGLAKQGTILSESEVQELLKAVNGNTPLFGVNSGSKFKKLFV
jgi:calcium-dependent protein kinase